jgi:hypothetical protein
MTVRDGTIAGSQNQVPDHYPLHQVNDSSHFIYTHFTLPHNNFYRIHVSWSVISCDLICLNFSHHLAVIWLIDRKSYIVLNCDYFRITLNINFIVHYFYESETLSPADGDNLSQPYWSSCTYNLLRTVIHMWNLFKYIRASTSVFSVNSCIRIESSAKGEKFAETWWRASSLRWSRKRDVMTLSE